MLNICQLYSEMNKPQVPLSLRLTPNFSPDGGQEEKQSYLLYLFEK